MDIRVMRYFLAVAREGNVTRAAAALHVTQPTLSRQLADLEAELGCRLVERGAHGVSLTEDGMLLRARAEEIVELADRAESELRNRVGTVGGPVFLGAGETRALDAVAACASSLMARHPGVSLHLHSGNATDICERVDRGLLDFGVLVGHEPGRGYDSIALPHEDRWGVLVRESDPLAGTESIGADDLASRPVLAGAQEASAEAGGGMPLPGLEVAGTYTLLFNASLVVRAGGPAAVCLDGIVPAGPGTGLIFVPLAGVAPVRSHLIWRRPPVLSRAASAFLEELRALVG